MENIFDYLIGNFNQTDAPVSILVLLVAVFLFYKFARYVITHWSDIKNFLDDLYHRRRKREELLEKIDASFEATAKNTEEIKQMRGNYIVYHEQSISIRDDLKNSIENINRKIDNTRTSNDQISDLVVCIKSALIEILNDRITQKCQYYTRSGGIPEDETEDFQRMFDVYNAIGGNHGLEFRFNKTKELPVIQKKED